jgi:drug/metabolite transporter (DMT)-like permease
MTPVLLALTGVLLSSLAQLLLKQAANMSLSRQRFDLAWLNPYAILGYGLLLSAVLTSAYVLRYLGVGVLTSLTALAYPLVAVLSGAIFKETICSRQWLGMTLICGGVLVFNSA